MGTLALVSLGPAPFALQKRMKSAARRASSWTPRESFVWVSTFPHPAWTREASQPGMDGLSWPSGWRACECRPPALPPDRDECSGSPSPCSHSCHNAPGHFSCACPAGFALARDERNCRGERAPGGEAGARRRCVQGVQGPRQRARTPGDGLFLRALDASPGFPMPCSHWDFLL